MREGRNKRHRTAGSRRVRLWALLTGAIMLAAVVLTGCADFSAQDRDRAAGDFSANNDAPQNQQQTPTPEPSTPENQGPPPTGPCVDPDPQVIATCLASTGGLMPGDDQATTTVVAERTTGKLITAKRYGPQRAIASFDVDGSGDGGLVDFALSPTYSQDRLIYALITTPSDNRVVRIAPGDVAKPILTGIPKGATGNMGALYFRSPTELLVATGDAGDPSAAANPASLAGKLLSVTSFGSGANPPPKVVASGFGSNVALCHNDTGALYVADRTSTEDRLQIVESAGPKVLWTWPDKPDVAGCAVSSGQIFVTTTRTQQILALTEPTREKPTITPPAVVLEKRYGALGRIVSSASGAMLFATVNKASGKPVATDDRVVRFIPPASSENRT
ncbi:MULTISPECIES: PQQ-dependent sugar dehydrogenase [Gordonia]|uniref:PQQ-dependent sugar dehydrogenase n=1 Tax=Gordonia TaxID=2053 RepID=UPI0009EE3883|nr:MULTISPECIES: PQQ-dependent sugar dehydrogenase [Gordonia]NKY93736.1 glucose dehydrogenase [Gordonia sputi]